MAAQEPDLFAIEDAEDGVSRYRFDLSDHRVEEWEDWHLLVRTIRKDLGGVNKVRNKRRLSEPKSRAYRDRFFDIVLTSRKRLDADQTTIQGRFNKKDLYLIAVRLKDRDTWNELIINRDGSSNMPEIETLTLPFKGDYPSLRHGKSDFTSFWIGFDVLNDSICNLFRSLSVPQAQRENRVMKTSIITISIMFPESIRFRLINLFLFKTYFLHSLHLLQPIPSPIPLWLSRLLNYWGTISDIWIDNPGPAECSKLLERAKLEFDNGNPIETMDHVREALGILKAAKQRELTASTSGGGGGGGGGGSGGKSGGKTPTKKNSPDMRRRGGQGGKKSDKKKQPSGGSTSGKTKTTAAKIYKQMVGKGMKRVTREGNMEDEPLKKKLKM